MAICCDFAVIKMTLVLLSCAVAMLGLTPAVTAAGHRRTSSAPIGEPGTRWAQTQAYLSTLAAGPLTPGPPAGKRLHPASPAAGGRTKERVTPVTTRSPAPRWTRRPSIRRTGAACAAAVAAGTLLTSTNLAAAAPQPSISQVKQKLNKLLSQQDQAIQQYDQAKQALASAQQRMKAVSRNVSRHRAEFQAAHTEIAQLAAAAYENGSMTSPGALLTSSDPNTVLSQAAMISHLSTSQATEIRILIASAQQLTSAQRTAARTEAAVKKLEGQQLARRKAVEAAVAKQKSLLAQLTAAQQAAVTATGTTTGTYSGPTNTQAGQAVSFAYAQLGKPYVYGATGPNSYDCSGLVQAAWAAAGVSIPRSSYEQWAALPHVPMSAIQPGDLIFFDAEGHVGIYVGNNMIIDAPQPGQSVEKVSLSQSWYASTLDGAARP